MTIPEHERHPDLATKLLEELPGIFAWSVRGCLDWQRNGLAVPPAVEDAVREYRSEMDVVGQFIEERCVVHDKAQFKATSLYAAYRKWAEQSGDGPVTQTKFGNALSERGFHKKKAGIVLRLGLELANPEYFVDE